MNELKEDRLYGLLPAVYRMRDAEQGEPLKALLRVISEQVYLVEEDITRLYENWFIETCEDWVVPYIGDLIGYELVHEAGDPSAVDTSQGRQRNKILIPRREVANTIRYRRRKGTLALLELLANAVAGWPARSVEFYKLLGWNQSVNHLHLDRGQTIDIRRGAALDLLDSPFDELTHTLDVRRIDSHHTQGHHNIPGVGVFVWRLQSYSVTQTPAYCLESAGPHCFTFSVLGNDSPLYMRPKPETDPTHIADEFNVPAPIRRRLFADYKAQLYGNGRSMHIWVGKKRGKKIVGEPVSLQQIIPADLSDWQYAPPRGKVAVDPILGRIAFPTRLLPKNGVWVSYHYGFSMDLGGGEYERTVVQPEAAEIYRVGKAEDYKTINAALEKWEEAAAEHAVIELTDSGVYVEQINIAYKDGQESLQLRAGNRQRPIIRLLDWQTDRPDSLTVAGVAGSRFTLDGVLVTGRGVQVSGDMAELSIRHSTLVPGWTLDCDSEPQRCTEPSLEIFSPNICVNIDHSIIGSIQVDPAIQIPVEGRPEAPNGSAPDDEAVLARCGGIGREGRLDPIRICINDSILDATDPESEALGAPGCPVAHACVNIVRSTIFGQIQAHAIELGENALFIGRITVAHRQKGCLRFCYVSPNSRTPRRYRCHPDLAERIIEDTLMQEAEDKNLPKPSEAQIETARQCERLRVRPRFNSDRYGIPTYCQLANDCAEEIVRGADDESEIGVFHDLFQPQRAANLHARLEEYSPSAMDAGLLYVN